MFPEVADTSPLLQHLNAEQLAAVTLPDAHALILAGAGSGKTRVLTTRIAWLMGQGRIGAGNVMAVTFTNKAAKEMMTRLGAMLPVNVRGMWIGTFHGLCNRLLRAHYKLAHLPSTFQILDTQDQLAAIKRLMKQHGVDEERFPAKETQWFIAGCKEDGLRPAGVEVHNEQDRRKVQIYQLYDDQCQREGVVDFGELMLRSYELLRDNDPIREHYRRRFRHILIDEFQDTNKLQYAWIKMFAATGEAAAGGADNSVFAVGDDDQSIYAFRGARVGNMADFVREFHVAHQIKLEQNYRSFSNILDSANALIAHNKTRLGKNLRTDQGPGQPVRVYEAPTDLAEAQWMVEEMRHLVRGDGAEESFRRSEIAVLYRSNAQSRVIETALFNAGVPYRVYGGLRFFERAEIKHALAYLRLLENPHDDTSFLRVVNFPPRGIGARSIEQLQDAARAANCSLHDAVRGTTGKAGANLAAFAAKVEALRAQTQGMTLREIIEQVLEASSLIEHYKSERDGADRVENLEELVNAAESFVTQEGFGRDAVALPVDELRQSPASQGIDFSAQKENDLSGSQETVRAEPVEALDGPSTGSGRTDGGAGRTDVELDTGETLSPLAAFLTHAALESGDNQAQAGQEAVQLMTVHSAKGLEFDCVFVTGLEEGLFPSERSLADHDGLEEERRLMYVAITRARKRLYLSHSQTRMLHGQTRYNVKSRFFEELPEHALKWLTPKNQNFGGSAFGYGMGYPSTRNTGSRDFPRDAFAAAPVPPQKAQPAHGIRAGMKVFHNKFGEGAVMTLEGTGDDARAQINFPRHGLKWLALSVAKLTPVH
ncbi:UvrD-helicase domain-containing protein [Ramlibacter sp.]|uniref:UvrD-helicase domain-containing protein n=1 Tax=Ramlibacter sp. TaxID=1917967 RepID=UPI00184635ED|nr:UvrD-helicase domain-containing protein [Ramlibacter sp.]MBA2674767.1 UvrD-helicase domain-containing protein [Ramlibacter sp.]